MAGPLPLDPHDAVRRAANAHHERNAFPWGRFFAFLIVAGIFGWCFYQFYWQYHLPQERVLVDRDGKNMNVRIEEKDGGLLRLTSLTDGSKQLFPVSFLSEKDQRFCESIETKASPIVPFPYLLNKSDGTQQSITIAGYNDYFVEYTTATDPSSHYLPMSSLSAFDQAVVATLPKTISHVELPIDYVLTNEAGMKTPVRILGRSDHLVRYMAIDDGKTHTRLISTLTHDEQSMLNSFRLNLSDDFPIEWTLTTTEGKQVPVILTNKNADCIQYYLPADKDDQNQHLYPLEKLTPECREQIDSISGGKNIEQPYVCALTDNTGRILKAKILARSSDMVKLVVEESNKTYIYPIKNLAEMDQAFIKSLPKDLSNTWDLPELSASVQIARTQLIDLEKKITSLQNQLTRPDINGPEVEVFNKEILDYQKEAAHYLTEIKNDFETRIATVETENIALEGKIRNSNLSSTEKIALQNQILKNSDTVLALKTELEDVSKVGDTIKPPSN
jgi:hypothetical protein